MCSIAKQTLLTTKNVRQNIYFEMHPFVLLLKLRMNGCRYVWVIAIKTYLA